MKGLRGRVHSFCQLCKAMSKPGTQRLLAPRPLVFLFVFLVHCKWFCSQTCLGYQRWRLKYHIVFQFVCSLVTFFLNRLLINEVLFYFVLWLIIFMFFLVFYNEIHHMLVSNHTVMLQQFVHFAKRLLFFGFRCFYCNFWISYFHAYWWGFLTFDSCFASCAFWCFVDCLSS